MKEVEFILYVSNQERSTMFYRHLLKKKPDLYVDGMTEFQLLPGVKLGLMPVKVAAKILNNKMLSPSEGDGIPRCELYLKVTNAEKYMQRAIELGGELICEFAPQDWGDTVGYLADLDGHIIAFAEA